MANLVHNRLTVIKGNAEDLLKFISEQKGVWEPGIYTTNLKTTSLNKEEIDRVNITNSLPSIKFETKWNPLKEEQVQALLERFPEYEFFYHFSEEVGNYSDEEYHFALGTVIQHTVFPNWREMLKNCSTESEYEALESTFRESECEALFQE
jgi:hypothetical protein